MFKFKYQLNEEDYYEFSKFHMYNSPLNKKRIARMRFLCPAFFMMLSFLIYRATQNPVSYIIGGAISLLWIVFYEKLCTSALRKNINGAIKSGKLPVKNRSVLRFEEEGFFEKTELSEIQFPYTGIEQIVNGDSGIYIYTAATNAIIVPYQAFKNENEKKEFFEFIKLKANK